MIKDLNKAIKYVKEIMSSDIIKRYNLELKFTSLKDDVVSIYSNKDSSLKVTITWDSEHRASSIMVYKFNNLVKSKGILLNQFILLNKRDAKDLILNLIGRTFYTISELDSIIDLIYTFEQDKDAFYNQINSFDLELLKEILKDLNSILDIDFRTKNPLQLSNSLTWKQIYDIIKKRIMA